MWLPNVELTGERGPRADYAMALKAGKGSETSSKGSGGSRIVNADPICVLDLGLAVALIWIVPPNQARRGPRLIVPLLASVHLPCHPPFCHAPLHRAQAWATTAHSSMKSRRVKAALERGEPGSLARAYKRRSLYLVSRGLPVIQLYIIFNPSAGRRPWHLHVLYPSLSARWAGNWVPLGLPISSR